MYYSQNMSEFKPPYIKTNCILEYEIGNYELDVRPVPNYTGILNQTLNPEIQSVIYDHNSLPRLDFSPDFVSCTKPANL